MRNVYVFGAHSRAQTLAVYLKGLYEDCSIAAFLVNNDEINENEIDGIPVIHLEKGILMHTDYTVYLGIKGMYHEKVTGELKSLGFDDIRPVTVELDIELRNRYLKKLADEGRLRFEKFEDRGSVVDYKNRNDSTGEAGQSVCIYTVRSAFDKDLKDQSYIDLDCERGIQVGTDLTDIRLNTCDFYDNDGENISELNRQFCEVTAMYWMWKHAVEDVVGLVHYRRHFLLPDEWEKKMSDANIDVILPTPLYLAPSIGENYRFRHIAAHWDYMMEYLKGRNPEEYESAVSYFSGNWFCPCNMFIMRRQIFNEFCEWLFPILFAVRDFGGWLDDTYQNRYPAFMTERLLSWYFDSKKDDYHIVYADKNFLE